MNRQSVSSSQITSVGHDGTMLEVEFNNGAVYQYEGVSVETFEELINSPSIGAYFNENIKHGKYSYRRV